VPRAVRIAIWGLLVIVPVALVLLPLPYYGLGPGPARDLAPLIRFDELRRFDSGGRFVLTTVRWKQLTPMTAIQVWFDDAWDSMTYEELFGGLTREEEEAISRAQMTQSQIHAARVVLARVTDYPDEHGPGALIDGTFAPCPADGVVFIGEIVTAIDGEPVGSLDEASRLIDGIEPGEETTFEILSGDTRREVELAPERCVEGRRQAYIGFGLIDAFPIDVDIETDDVGGPSGGLMFALTLYDLLTPGDLTDGQTIAGTGTLDLEGTVGPIGGIDDKVLAAESAGASLFLTPRENLEELRGIDTGDMRVVAVGTFDDAVDVLLEAGGTDVAEAVPTAA
jgi:PDZ domain-containing protein